MLEYTDAGLTLDVPASVLDEDTVRYFHEQFARIRGNQIRTALVLENSWANAGGTQPPATVTQHVGNRLVEMRGVVTGGTTTSGTRITTLSEIFRPANDLSFPQYSNGTVFELRIIAATGFVEAHGTLSATALILNCIYSVT